MVSFTRQPVVLLQIYKLFVIFWIEKLKKSSVIFWTTKLFLQLLLNDGVVYEATCCSTSNLQIINNILNWNWKTINFCSCCWAMVSFTRQPVVLLQVPRPLVGAGRRHRHWGLQHQARPQPARVHLWNSTYLWRRYKTTLLYQDFRKN